MTDRSPSPLPPTILERQGHHPVPIHPAPVPVPRYDHINIFRDALLKTEGRDKVVKLLQYTSRLVLLLSSTPSKRLRPFISQMSMTRKVLKLGHGIIPYCELTKGHLKLFALVREVVEFINDFWDDVYCLSRIGVLKSPRVQRISEEWANRAWMIGIIMDLHVLLKRRKATREALTVNDGTYFSAGLLLPQQPQESEKTRKKLLGEAYWIDVSILKLLADFGFCGLSLVNIVNLSHRRISFEST